jgi:Transposase DDE domain
MNHRVGLDRSQTLLLPETLEDYVSAENPVRFLDAFVTSVDLHALGFAKARCANTGRPPYDPAALLKLYLYGYVCPGEQELTYRFSTYELGRGLRYYRASGCKDCALRKQCTRNKGNRTITREDNEELMEAMAQRMRAQPEKYNLRKQLAEHPFGTIKRWMGYTHFTLKGLEKVRTEWSLITLVYNLKRVLKLVSFEKLMAAVI